MEAARPGQSQEFLSRVFREISDNQGDNALDESLENSSGEETKKNGEDSEENNVTIILQETLKKTSPLIYWTTVWKLIGDLVPLQYHLNLHL